MQGGLPPVVGRRLLLVAIGAAVVGALFVLSFAYGEHAPAPHDVRVAVVAPPAVVAKVDAGLRRAAPGAFIVVRSPSAGAARDALRHQQIRGALVLGPGRSAQVLTAGAAGLTLQEVVETALGDAARAAGRHAAPVDVVPLPAGDRGGVTAFFLEIGMLLPSVLGASALYLVGIRSRVWWRVAAATLFAVLAGGLGVLVVDWVLGALTGPWLAMWGICTLGALSFVLCVAAAQATFGLPATGVMALAFIFVGNPMAGGAVPTAMLPDVYRQLSPYTPNAGIVHGIRSVVYFDGHGAGAALLVLALWAAGGLYVLVINDLLHMAARRAVPPEQHPAVYATPGAVHARRMWRGRGGGPPLRA